MNTESTTRAYHFSEIAGYVVAELDLYDPADVYIIHGTYDTPQEAQTRRDYLERGSRERGYLGPPFHVVLELRAQP